MGGTPPHPPHPLTKDLWPRLQCEGGSHKLGQWEQTLVVRQQMIFVTEAPHGELSILPNKEYCCIWSGSNCTEEKGYFSKWTCEGHILNKKTWKSKKELIHLSLLGIVNFTHQRVLLHLKRPLIWFSFREIWQEQKRLRKDPYQKTLQELRMLSLSLFIQG